jgi:DNA polymerase-1
MKLLIDGDLVVYRIGFTCEEVTRQDIVAARVDEFLTYNIFNQLEFDDYEIFLTSTDHSNFRYEIDPEYKQNRKDTKKPIYYDFIRQYLEETYNTTVIYGAEADDALASQVELLGMDNAIICTIDKDLDQVPGLHFNFIKQVTYSVSEEEGIKYFYTQILIGDPTDNIKGLYGIGPKKAEKILAGLSEEIDLDAQCAQTYLAHHRTIEEYLMNKQLLWMKRDLKIS